MSDFHSVLSEAMQLSQGDRLRLIDALWAALPADAELPLHADWELELERRVAAIKDGTAQTVPWEKVRSEALARIGHDRTH